MVPVLSLGTGTFGGGDSEFFKAWGASDVAHAKLRDGWDFGRCLRIAKESGFTGMYSIEAGGKGDPYTEVQTIADALVANL